MVVSSNSQLDRVIVNICIIAFYSAPRHTSATVPADVEQPDKTVSFSSFYKREEWVIASAVFL